LNDLFINIIPLKVVDCYFIHMHQRIDSSSSRSDPSANGYIDLDFTSRCNVDAPRPPTSTTRFNFGLCRNVRAQQRRVRLLQLREEARRPASDYFDYSSRLETSQG
jgi:hypothetical protein